jgi:hypothetical protein
MTKLEADAYRAWQQGVVCQACDSSDLMLLEPSEMARGYYPSPRQEEWECQGCATVHTDTINCRLEWRVPAYLYDREASTVLFRFETVNGDRLELAGVNSIGIVDEVVAWPPWSKRALVDLFMGYDGAYDAARYGYVEGWKDGDEIVGENGKTLGIFKIIAAK